VVVFLDNAWFRRRCQLYALVAAVGVFLVFLPMYSSDFDGIEPKWVNMKCALPDLMLKCENLQGAVYTHFAASNC
jgi:transposase